MLDLSTYMSVSVFEVAGKRGYLYVRGANSFGSIASRAGILCVSRRLLYDAKTEATILKNRSNYNHLIRSGELGYGE